MIPASSLSAIVGSAVADALAAYDAKKAQEAEAAKKSEEVASFPLPVIEEPAKKVAATAKKAIYGNQDKKKEFDLTKLFPNMTELPTDKAIVIIQKHMILSDKSTKEDETARRGQIVDLPMYEQSTKPDKFTAKSPYDTLFGTPGEGGGYVTVHKPE